MNKTVLLISELLQDLNRMKDWFPVGYRIKGINSYSAVGNALRSELPGIIVLRIRSLEDFFHTYEMVRTSVNNSETPIIAVADMKFHAALVKNVALKKTRVVGGSVTDDNMRKIVLEVIEKGE